MNKLCGIPIFQCFDSSSDIILKKAIKPRQIATAHCKLNSPSPSLSKSLDFLSKYKPYALLFDNHCSLLS
jgi:hypothetical protein